MNYQETLDYLYNNLPMYQRTGPANYKMDLKRTYELMELLGNPHRQFKTIHVAGTNGKGSVSHMLSSILQTKGFKVGLYTSPHLVDFRERIRINGNKILPRTVCNFVTHYKPEFDKIKPSFFEITMALAFDFFAREKVDIAVVEVGLGGRLDSTNIIQPELSIITNIGMDHMHFLGNSHEKIAAEKAGIIKDNVPVVIGETQPEIKLLFDMKARQHNSRIFYADKRFQLKNIDISGTRVSKMEMDVLRKGELFISKLNCPLFGSYQANNVVTTIMAIEILKEGGYKFTKSQVRKGINDVVEKTGLRGRWEILAKTPTIIADIAHNEDGLTYVMEQLQKIPRKSLRVILGLVNDKNFDSVLKLFPDEAIYYFCKADIPRGLPAEELAAEAGKHGLTGDVYPSVTAALKAARSEAHKEDVIFIGGSTFTVAEILKERTRIKPSDQVIRH
ncbi:MAG: bifunctional folylpolyglutamate synthase/dihydrofolate synthase [Bacteroidales bacterium]|nr:bifunctional folylpolyglutamate synthase/dihydrofolate synthase [Bacteroidales bacterium]